MTKRMINAKKVVMSPIEISLNIMMNLLAMSKLELKV